MVTTSTPSAVPAVPSKTKALCCVYAVVLIDQLASALTQPVMPFFIQQQFEGSASIIGSLFSTFAIGQLLSSAWMGVASDKFGRSPLVLQHSACSISEAAGQPFDRRPIMLISLFGACLGLLGSAFAPTLPLFFVARGLLCLTRAHTCLSLVCHATI